MVQVVDGTLTEMPLLNDGPFRVCASSSAKADDQAICAESTLTKACERVGGASLHRFCLPEQGLGFEDHTIGEKRVILSCISDQGLFPAHMYLASAMQLRLQWFPDVNHQSSNIDKSLLGACGFEQVDGLICV